MNFFKRWPLWMLAFLFFERGAYAQVTGPTVTINPVVTRNLPNGSSAAIRPQNLNPTGISFEDCENNIVLNFSLLLGGSPWTSYHLEAWVGNTDCTQSNARNPNSGAALCWPAAPQGITPAQTVTVPVRAQDVVAYEANITKPATYTAAGEEACHVQNQSGAVALSIYFIWLDGTGNAAGSAGKYDISTDLRGPDAPSNVTAGQGDTLLIVNWSPAIDTDTQGFTVYCDPPPGQEGAATSSADGGTTASDAAVVSSACPSAVLVSGGGTTSVDDAGVPTTTGATQTLIDPKYICKTLGGGTNTNATLDGLQNGTTYTVAVAGTDNFGNVGPLSTPACAAPVPVNDFWKIYKNSGGQAGGGFCTLSAPGLTAKTSPLVLTIVGGLVWMIRRRRRRS